VVANVDTSRQPALTEAPIQVVAHRGASEDVPEHTLAAYQKALQDGADALECDVRLTADGQVRNCLFAREESDLRGPLRAGADDRTLAALLRRAVRGKRAGHGIDDPTFLQPARPMSAIGG